MIVGIRITFVLILLIFFASLETSCDGEKNDSDLCSGGDFDCEFSQGEIESEESEESDAEDAHEDETGNLKAVDLIRYARLSADDTAHQLFPWPQEAKDAIATIRDENTATSWKIPENTETRLEIDWQPSLGTTAMLQSATARFKGEISSLRIESLSACGSRPVEVKIWENPEAPLELGNKEAACINIFVQTIGSASLEELRIIALVNSDFLYESVRPVQRPVDETAMNSGAIEGFYGVPWSWDERLRMVDLLSASGQGTYLYCPKSDDKHRANWREAYDEDDLSLFKQLINHCNEKQVRFSFGISPFLDYRENASDYDILREKVLLFVEMGSSEITLLADDIEFDNKAPVDAEMGRLHCEIANRLLADIRGVNPEASLVFVPTVYSDDRIVSMPEGEAYFESLAELDSSIGVMWTGPATSNALMNATDINSVSNAIGRKVIIWDNFWANDGGDGFMGRILLGAFSGRDASLKNAVSGIRHNPSIQGSLSRLTLSTFSEYLKDPVLYNEEVGLAAALEYESMFRTVPEHSRESDLSALRFVMELFDGNAQSAPGHRRMMFLIDSLILALSSGSLTNLEDISELQNLFARMAVLCSEVHHSGLAADLVDELEFPLQKIKDEGECGLWILQAIAEKMNGQPADEVLRKAKDAQSRSLESRFQFSDNRIGNLLKVVSKLSPKSAGISSLQSTNETPPECQAGSLWRYRSFQAAEKIAVYGLAGAEIVDGGIEWTAPHRGVFKAVIVVFNNEGDPGWGFMPLELICDAGK